MADKLNAGGKLDESHLYVERRADRELPELLGEGQYCFVLAPRQMGKSSLQHRLLLRLRESGALCASIDLSLFGTDCAEVDSWYFSLLALICDAAGLPRPISAWQREFNLSAPLRFVSLLRSEVLSCIESPLVIFIDELDSIASIPKIRDDFLAAIRALYNARAEYPD